MHCLTLLMTMKWSEKGVELMFDWIELNSNSIKENRDSNSCKRYWKFAHHSWLLWYWKIKNLKRQISETLFHSIQLQSTNWNLVTQKYVKWNKNPHNTHTPQTNESFGLRKFMHLKIMNLFVGYNQMGVYHLSTKISPCVDHSTSP
jgi:hypothetical protein